MTATVRTNAEAGWIEVPAVPDIAAPLRALDRLRVEREGTALRLTALMAVRGDEPNLRGHFPGQAIYPGVFVIETLVQAMRLAVRSVTGEGTELREIRSVRFLAPLLDGDRLTLTAVATARPGGWDVRATGTRADGTPAARISAEFISAEFIGAEFIGAEFTGAGEVADA